MGKAIVKVVLDFAILGLLAFPLLYITLWGKPYRSGYFLNDQSLMLPYRPDTVSVPMLSIFGFGVSLLTIIAVEGTRHKKGRRYYLGERPITGWLWESYVTYGIWTFGVVCQHLTCDSIKMFIGRLRPHFFTICRPEVLPSPLHEFDFVINYECTGTDDAFKLKDLYLSFPSAHASFVMYLAVFFAFYIQKRIKWKGSKLLRHAFQYGLLIAAIYVSITRITDHMHHWDDVVAGNLIGAFYGVLVFKYVLKPKDYDDPVLILDSRPENMLPRPILAPSIAQ